MKSYRLYEAPQWGQNKIRRKGQEDRLKEFYHFKNGERKETI